jgi:hypothetical protein
LRTYDASGLVAKQNAEYGALRNLFAVRGVFTIESAACLIGTLILWFVFRKPGYIWAAAGACTYLIVGIVAGWQLLPRMVELAANTYGKNAWLTFVEIANRKPRDQSREVCGGRAASRMKFAPHLASNSFGRRRDVTKTWV